MDRARRTSTVRQLELLVEFAEANKDLALGRLRSKEARALSARLWNQCSDSLNAEGPARSPKEWAKVWNDLKSRVRTKVASLTLSQRGTGGGPNTVVILSALEERVADIIGRDIGPIPNVAQDQLRQASPEESAVSIQWHDMDLELHESNEIVVDDQLQLPGPSHALPGPSHALPYESPPRPAQSPAHMSPPPSAPPPPSTLSTPRRRRLRPRQSPRQRTSRQSTSRINTQALTRQAALDESRAMVMRIEELRANTDNMLAQAALRQAEASLAQAEAARVQADATRVQADAARVQADAARVQAEAWSQFLSGLMPAVQTYLRGHTSRQTQRLPSAEEDEEGEA